MDNAATENKTQRDKQFQTDHLLGDLKGRAARGGAIALISQSAKFALHIGSTMILARLLTPADFGMIAMVSAFTGFVMLFRDLGLTAATVQRGEVNHSQVSTVFWINVGVSIVLAGIVASMAPFVAWLYGEPELSLVTAVIGATFVFGGFTSQHTALLQRQMRFTTLAGIEITAMTVGIAVAIVLAWQGAEYWALVAMTGATAFMTMVLSWLCSGWLPGWPRRDAGVMDMLRFGGNLMGFNVLSHVRRNADNVLLGMMWGSAPLGLYSKAYALVMLPVNQLIRPISSVMVASLSRVQDSPAEYTRFFCKAAQASLYLALPVLTYLIVMAEEVVLIILGAHWIEAAFIFQILSIFAITQVVAATTGWIFISLAQTDRMFRWQIFQASFMVLAFIIGVQWGPEGVALAATSASSVTIFPYLAFAFRKSPVSMQMFFSVIKRPVALAVIFGLTLYCARILLNEWLLIWKTLGVTFVASAVVIGIAFSWRSVRNDLHTVSGLLQKSPKR